MDEFVIAYNSGETPVLVGDRYIHPGQNRRVLRRYYDEAKKTHPALILPNEKKTKPLDGAGQEAPKPDTPPPVVQDDVLAGLPDSPPPVDSDDVTVKPKKKK